MSNALLTLNAGSSSIKFALFALTTPIPSQPEIVGQIDGIGAQPHLKAKDKSGQSLDDIDLPLSTSGQHHAALEFLVDWLHRHESGWQIVGVGHRVVHGGKRYARPVVLDGDIMAELKTLIPLAPLHQPHNLDGIDALREALPAVPQVACFDTAFHRSQTGVAQLYALPRRITELGVRRYGFHGLSYEYIADVLPQYLGTRADGRIIVAHLGNGASMCALRGRKSQASTMGFSTIEGLMMGTRCGSLDPGVMLYLMDYQGMDAKSLTRLLYKESGLLGVSGLSQDMRELLASDKPEAAEAVELFCYRVVREIGSLAAAIGGLDALVFTGGVVEHAVAVRNNICQALDWLGIGIDADANAESATRISHAASKVDALVLPTNEEWMIARHTAKLVAS